MNVLIYCGQLDDIWNNYHVQKPPLNIRVSFEHLTVFTSILIKSCVVCTQSEYTSIPEKYVHVISECVLYHITVTRDEVEDSNAENGFF